MMPAPSFAQWALLRRMRAAGCPIAYTHLTLPSRPLAAVSHPVKLTGLGTSNVFVANGQAWIVLWVNLNVSAKIGIGPLRLRAHWLHGPAELVKPCSQHAELYCLPLGPGGGHVGFSSEHVMNSWGAKTGILDRGVFVKRFLLAKGTDSLASCHAPELDIEICIDDWLGQEMVFPVTIVNRR
jgi:hypothetical protein